MDFTIFLEPTIMATPHFGVTNSNLYDKRYQIERYRIQLKRRSISEKRHISFNRLDNEVTEKPRLYNYTSGKKSNTPTTSSKKIYRSTTCKQKYQARR